MATSNNNFESNLNTVTTNVDNSSSSGEGNPPSGVWFIPEHMTLPARMQKGPSHSRRQPASHIPRPRNPFILFRSHFLSMEILPTSIEFCRDHRQISRIVSCVWVSLSNEDRLRFFELGNVEKANHKARYPSYKTSSKDTRVRVTLQSIVAEDVALNPEEVACKKIAQLIVKGVRSEELTLAIQSIVETIPKYRSSSQKLPKKRSAAPRQASRKLAALQPDATAAAGKSSSKSGRVSSTTRQTSDNILVSVYARTTNPPRRRSAVNYAEYDSDESEVDELEFDDIYDDGRDTDSEDGSFPSRDLSVTPSTLQTSSLGSYNASNRSARASGASDHDSSAMSPSTLDGSDHVDVEMFDEAPSGYVDWSRDVTISQKVFGDDDDLQAMDCSQDVDISDGSPYASFGVHCWDGFQPDGVVLNMFHGSTTRCQTNVAGHGGVSDEPRTISPALLQNVRNA